MNDYQRIYELIEIQKSKYRVAWRNCIDVHDVHLSQERTTDCYSIKRYTLKESTLMTPEDH